jgi:hypothetical protein
VKRLPLFRETGGGAFSFLKHVERIDMNPTQQNHLLGRLHAAKNQADWNVPKIPEPAAVRHARGAISRLERVVGRHEKRVAKYAEVYKKRVRKACDKVREIILFGEPTAALKAVQEFERREFT